MVNFTMFYEKFAHGVKSHYGYSEIYLNPNASDISDMVGQDKFASFRGIIDPENNLYVWVDKAAIHEEVLEKLNLNHNYEAIPLYIYPGDVTNVIISYWSRGTATDKDKQSYYDRVMNNSYLKDFLGEPIKIKKFENSDEVKIMEGSIQEKSVGKKQILGDPKELNVFVEPTDREIQYLLQIDKRGIRGGVDSNGTVYVWKLTSDPKLVQSNFNLTFLADLKWDPNNRTEADIKLLDAKWDLNKINEDLLKKIDYGMINAFPFLQSYNITDYAGKNLKTREL